MIRKHLKKAKFATIFRRCSLSFSALQALTIIDMERKKQLTPYQVGRRVLYKLGEVEENLKSFKRV